jgi:dTDP-4-dehydrorhamnose 3,5-epimerase
MNVQPTRLPGVLLIEPRIFRDDRGYFLETWSRAKSGPAGLPVDFVQDNLSSSKAGVLRGLHYQHPTAQGKFVSVLRGEVFDVVVDIRVGSPTFGQWEGLHALGRDRPAALRPRGLRPRLRRHLRRGPVQLQVHRAVRPALGGVGPLG